LQRYDESQLPNEPWTEDANQEPSATQIIKGFKKRKFTRKIPQSRFSGATTAVVQNQVQTILDQSQLFQCALSYTNNGVVRGIIDRSVFFIQGERTDFTIVPNEELTVDSTDQEAAQIDQDIKNDTLTYQGKNVRINDLKRKTIRCNTRVKLHPRIETLLTNCLVYGRGGLEIVRFPTDKLGIVGDEPDDFLGDWPIYGEPRALVPLFTRRIVDVEVEKTTKEFQGFYYDDPFTNEGETRYIKSTNLIAGFHGDNNLFDNTYYSGTSAIWPVLAVSQADDVINDEDMPESVRNLGAAFGFIYAGTNDKSKHAQIRKELENNTWLVHGLENFKAEVHDLARDLMQLPNVRNADAKYMCMCMNLPLFLMFEDTANFATANQVMQVYKSGMLKRYRTWLQGILEENWYNPILADHLGIPLKDVISAPIKIKPIFPDINFETRKDIIDADKILYDMSVFNEEDIARDIDRKDIAQRIAEEAATKEQLRQEAINEAVSQVTAGFKQAQALQNGQAQQQQMMNGQNPQPPQLAKAQAQQKQGGT